MRQKLKLHPDSVCAGVTSIDVDVARSRDGILFAHYVMTGVITDVLLPPPSSPTRADELWRTTCFEAFIAAPSYQGYREFNFAPSSQWAAYQFTGYREGMSALDALQPPRIGASGTDTSFEIAVTLDLSAAEFAGALRLGLSAIIEETSGNKSYWALAHPPGKPDFHHADCFALQLPPA